jgi:Tfp pilus assembly protein PilF
MMSNVYEWSFPVAARGFRRALELDPGYANGYLFYGVFLAAQGYFKQAQTQLDQAAQIDPLSPIIALCRGYPASFQGHVEPAIQAAREALNISPGFPAAIGYGLAMVKEPMQPIERDVAIDFLVYV